MIITDGQRKIIDAFFRTAKQHPNEKITMQMVAECAKINKATIYRYHFCNTKEIIEKIHLMVDEKVGNEFEEFASSSNSDLVCFIAHKILPALYENKEYLKVLYGTDIDPDWLDFLESKYSPLVEKYLDRIKKSEVVPNFYLSQIVVKEILSLISVWLTDDDPEPASIFQKTFLEVLKLSPADILTKNNLH